MAYDNLPNELVMDIMSRVRGKTLARFRSVSKNFRSLLSDPCFIRLHLNRSRESLFTLTALAAPQRNHAYTLGYEYDLLVTNKANDLVHKFALNSIGYRRMLSSHHQLVCFACESGIHLCDPVNKNFVKLPDPPLYLYTYNRYDKMESPVVSFGFVEATMQYKVVKWPHNLEEQCTRRLPSGLVTVWKKINLRFSVLNINILEGGRLQVSSWKRLNTPCPYLLQPTSQVHVNGFIYWTTSDFQVVSFSYDTFSILNSKPPCFHRDTQGLQESRRFTLSGSYGILWMIDYDIPSQIMEIWKMKQIQGGNGSWAKIHNIDLRMAIQ